MLEERKMSGLGSETRRKSGTRNNTNYRGHETRRMLKSPSVTADLAVSESLEELACLAPIPAPSESESLGVGPEYCMFKKAPRLTLTCGPCQNNCARLTLTLGRRSLRLREGRYLDQSCFHVVTGKGPRFPDSPSSALREGTAPSRAPRHMYITPLTIWFLAVFLNDLVDLSV